MRVVVYLPLIVAGVLGLLGPALLAAMPPRAAVRTGTAAALGGAVASTWSLALLAWSGVQDALETPIGAYSARALATRPVPLVTAVGALLGLALAATFLTRQLRTWLKSSRLLQAIGLSGWCSPAVPLPIQTRRPAELVLLSLPAAQAYARPGTPAQFALLRNLGRLLPGWLRTPALGLLPEPRLPQVLMCEQLREVLAPGEWRVVLAHEAAHLDHRHGTYRLVVRGAAAVNPALRPLLPAVDYAVERWADEDAARAVGSRRTCANALGRAALATHGRPQPLVGPAVAAAFHHHGHAVQRVRALLAPAPRSNPAAAGLLHALALTAVLAGALAAQDLAQLSEAADQLYP